MKIDFEDAKKRIMDLIDTWSSEIIEDLFNEIKIASENKNIRDVELTLDSIRDIEKQSYNIKQSISKSTTTRQIFLSIECDIFDDAEETILSKFLDTRIQIKKD
jgi:hypothetical protein